MTKFVSRFLSSSSTLCRQLPGEKEAEHTSISGVVFELHLPAGGVVQLDHGVADQLKLPTTDIRSSCYKVSFHRSRLMINGVRMSSEQRLDKELVPGDKVSVDIVRNRAESAFVMSESDWAAVCVRVNTVTRGVTIAEDMRHKGQADSSSNFVCGRVVYLKHPETSEGAAVSGVAVVDTGQYLGQRVEFDRDVCIAFGQSLNKADLSHVFKYNDIVNIKLKAYNSYCVDSLWIGFEKGNNWDGSLDHQQTAQLEFWLDKRKLSFVSFDHLLRGECLPRRFLPLIGQDLAGEVISLVEDETGLGTGLRIRTQCGRVVVVDRESLYVFSHWMGRADLAYCLPGEKVSVVMCPRYVSTSEGGAGVASVAWVGGSDARPRYQGVSTSVTLSDTTRTHLKLWLQTKKFGMGIFKALVDGKLPSKKEIMDVITGQGSESSALKLNGYRIEYGDRIMSSLLSMFRSETAPIPGLTHTQRQSSYPPAEQTSTTSSPPPEEVSSSTPPPGEESSSSFSLLSSSAAGLTALPIPTLTTNYYSSSAVTANYSSGPKPPQQQQQQQHLAYPPPPPPSSSSSQYYQYYHQN